jgi:hypothetical protein
MITVTTKLSVKELAGPLGVTVSYLYKARRVGLPMCWDEETRCFVQTEGRVRRWIKREGFRVVNGVPVVKSSKRLTSNLQTR